MIRALRYLLKKFYIVFAIALIALAVLVQCGRSFSYLVSDYRQDIADYLSDKLNADVQLGAIDVQWDGLRPVVDARDIRITSYQQEPILAVQEARMRLNLLASLINFRLVWTGINWYQSELVFEQTRDGFWRIPGLRLQHEKEHKAARLDVLFDMLLLSHHIEFHQTHLAFDFVDGHRISLDSPSVLLENRRKFHRLSLQVDVEEHKHAVSIILEGQGDPRNQDKFRAKGYVEFNQFPTSEPLTAAGALLLPGIDDLQWRSDGALDAKLWFSSRANGAGFDLTGQLGLQTLSLPLLGRRLELGSFTTDVRGHWLRSGGWRLALQNLSADVNKTHIQNLNLAATVQAANAPLQLQTDKVDLQRWMEVLDDAGAFANEKLRDVLLTLNPQGLLRNLRVRIPLNEPAQWQLEANLEQVGVSAWHGVPALTRVDGYLQAEQQGGLLNLSSRNGFSMHFQPTYAEPMEYDSARGQIAWHLWRDKNQIYVNSGALHLRKGDEQLTGYMWLSLPWRRNTGDIDLYLDVGAHNLAADRYKKYTPAVVPDSLLRWLDQSIGEHNNGRVATVGFIYRGTLNTKEHMARSHQVYLDIEQAELQYHPQWPPLRDLSGRVLLDDGLVDVSIDKGKVYSSELRDVRVHSQPNPAGEGALLSVNGHVQGPAGDALRVLRESMLRQYIGDNMDQWHLQGNMDATLDLAVPLAAGAPGARQRVDVDVQAGALQMDNFAIALQRLEGRISYDNKTGLSSKKLRAHLFDEPIAVRLRSQLGEHPKTLLDVDGKVAHETLAAWRKRPELLFLDGSVPYHARIEIIHRQSPAKVAADEESAQREEFADTPPAAIDRRLANIIVTSDLQGVAVDLPAPYGKPPESRRPLKVEVQINQQTMQLAADYGLPESGSGQTAVAAATSAKELQFPDNSVTALLRLPRSGEGLLNANIALASRAALPQKPQFLVSGFVPSFDIDQWQAVKERYLRYGVQVAPNVSTEENAAQNDEQSPVASPAQAVASHRAGQNATHIAGLPFRVDLTLGQYEIGVLSLKQLGVTAQPQADAWEFDFNNPTIAGHVRLPSNEAEPMTIALQYLHLSTDALKEEARRPDALEKAFNPRNLPLANVSVEQLYYEDDNFGSWSAEVRPDANGALLDNIHGNIRGVKVAALDAALDAAAIDSSKNTASVNDSAGKRGARLYWHHPATGERTRFVGTLTADNIGDVMQQWGITDFIESKSAVYNVDLSWAGAPQKISLDALHGDVDLLMTDGRFKRNTGAGSDGFLRLMALINFDSLARRLRLDFSDLYKSGLAYDKLQGKVKFDDGKLIFIDPLQVDSPSSRLQMAGSIDMVHETIDTRLIATLPVAGNLTFLAALATGLPAAAGVYVISKIFQKQVDQATSISYRIKGDWDEPEVKFDRLFESENSLRDSIKANGDVEEPEPGAEPRSLQ